MNANRAALYVLWLVLRACACFRPRRKVANLTRFYLTSRPGPDGSTGTPGWYLHRIDAPDPDREEHNHPWKLGRTLVLRGFYAEKRSFKNHILRVGDRAELRRHDFHRIILVSPGTWTLFHASEKHGKGWGFRQYVGGPVRSGREGRP